MKDVVDRNTVIAPQDPYIISGKNGVSELRVCKAGVKGCRNAVIDVKALAEGLMENLNNSGIEEEIISTSEGPVKSTSSLPWQLPAALTAAHSPR